MSNIQYFQPTEADIGELVKFNTDSFYYGEDTEDYIKYRFIENPSCEYPLDTIYSVKNSETGEYIGQMMTTPGKIIYNNVEHSVYWGGDYIVKESYRGSGIGRELTNHFLSKDYYITVGVSPTAEIIHKKNGCKSVGYLNSYYQPLSYFQYLRFIIYRLLKVKTKNLRNAKFPSEITIDTSTYKLIKSKSDFLATEKQWNPSIIETVRNQGFIDWRFLFKPDRYFIYQLQSRDFKTNPPYIACRSTVWKRVNCLKIVDFRYNISNPKEFEQLLEVAKKIAKKNNFFAITIASSLNISNNILTKKGYKLISKKVILTVFPFDFDEAQNDSNNKIMLTFSDSDSDFFTHKGNFVYGKDY